ncbi:MAG: long-chain fatty acid--CoA ligase [Burkholderiaceae bacterium]|jgi:long-chain acyl-CoA synthetase|nr:long-chain fatty acid--CoA ligase [Burkholderiaceae bacterium]
MNSEPTLRLTQALHRAVQQHGDRLATVFGARRQSYRALAARVARLASGLFALGVTPGDRVGVLLLNSDHYLEATLACWWTGAVLTPINTRWSAAEVAFSMNDCETPVLLIDRHHLAMLDALRAAVPVLKHVVFADDGPAPDGLLDIEALIASHAPIEDARIGDDALAGIFYTGGTTGRPKGVMLSHRNLYVAALGFLGEDYSVGADITLQTAPLFHMAGMSSLVNALFTGGRHVFLSAFTPEAVLHAISSEGVTSMLLVPTMIHRLVEHPRLASHDLRSLLRLQYAAAPMSSALLERALAALPNCRFVQAYGMTELAPHATVLPSRYLLEDRHLGKSASVGHAVRHTEVRIVDAEGQEVPRGTVGEIVVSGPNVMQGYWRRPAETAAVLRDGWLHTGDGGHMDEDGFVFLADRLKDMIISGGENIFSVEVENALAQHPSVSMCAVVGLPSETWGEAVHAVVVLRPGASVTPEELQLHCRSLIASYKCPRSFEFRVELPLSGTGKVLKNELRAAYRATAAKAD